MARISLQEQYDNKDVIHQIYGLKETVADAVEQIDAAVVTANEASATATSMGGRLTAVEESQATASAKADAAVKAEIKTVSVDAEGTDGFSVTLGKNEGSLNSGKFNLGKVKNASIKAGTATNSIYLQLELTDGTIIRSPDSVINISGVEADIHVTGLTLYEDPDSHGIYAVFTMNNGSTVRSNTVTYDYPGTATTNVSGLVKGSTADGGVAVGSDGSMTVNGYPALKERVANVEGRVTNVEEKATNTANRVGVLAQDLLATTNQTDANTEQLASHAVKLEEHTNQINQTQTSVSEINTTLGSEEIPEGSIKANINNIWDSEHSHDQTLNSINTRLDVLEPKVTKNTDRLANMMTYQEGRADSFFIGHDDTGYHYRFTNWPVGWVEGDRWILIVDEQYMGTVAQSTRTSGSKILNVWLSEELKASTDIYLAVSSAYPEGGRIVWTEQAFSQFARTSPSGLVPRVTKLEGDVTTINGEITGIKSNANDQSVRITNTETSINALNTAVNANTSSVGALTESVTTLTGSVDTLGASVDGKQDRLTAGDGIQISSDNTVSLAKTGAGSLNVRITPTDAAKGVIGEIHTEPYISGNYGYYLKFKFPKGTLRRDDTVKENNSVVDVIGDYYVDAMGMAPYCGINSSGSSEFDEIDLYMEKEWPVSSDGANALSAHFKFIRVLY